MYHHAILCGLIVRKITPLSHNSLSNTSLKISSLRNLASCMCTNRRSTYTRKWGYNSKVIPHESIGNRFHQSQYYRCSGTFSDRNKHQVKNSTIIPTITPSNNKSSLQAVLNEGSQSLSVNVPSRVPQISEILVNKCPSHVQPYLKLMRIDRPIGMFCSTDICFNVICDCALGLPLSWHLRNMVIILALRMEHCHGCISRLPSKFGDAFSLCCWSFCNAGCRMHHKWSLGSWHWQ